MDTKDTLINARKLIERPENWCQGAFFSNDAQCASGAIARAMNVSVHKAVMSPAYVAIEKVVGCVAEFNDTVSHAEILAAFDKAIAAAA